MRSLDTNVLARFFVEDPDDEHAVRQRPSAVAVLSERAFVTVTVMLEFEWVMRGFYDLPPAKVAAVMRALAGIDHLTLEDRGAVLAAIEALEAGLDFADALHLHRSGRASTFATFDRRLASRAAKRAIDGVPKIELLN